MMLRIFLLLMSVQTSLAHAILNPPALSSRSRLMKRTAFEETFERFPSPYAVFQQFKRIIPTDPDKFVHSECYTINEFSAPVLGVIEPLQLEALEKTPGELFYQYYQDCVHKIVEGGFSYIDLIASNLSYILGYELMADVHTRMIPICQDLGFVCDDPTSNRHYGEAYRFVPWSKFQAADQKAIMLRLIRYLVGPEEILRGDGYIGENNVFGLDLPSVDALADLLLELSRTITRADGTPATFKDIYAEIALTLRLGPAIKN